ncbi:MAG: ABC transporter permease [Acidobacteria bacterium]|nr:ABC transporter permease [Acidobacteriota bacterium]
MSTLLQDLRFGLRILARRPGFTAVAVLVLAIGIGANTAVFSIVNALVLRPLPAEQLPGTLVGLYGRDRVRPDSYRAFSYPNYRDIREENRVFSSLLAEGLALVGIAEGDTTRRAMAMAVSSNFFETLGEHLAVGRAFTPEEERPGSEAMVAVVSDTFWRSRGADPGMLGDTVRVNGRDYTVVGITSRGFTGATVGISPEVYVPLGSYELVVNDLFREGDGHTRLDDRENHALILIGRLHPGLTEEAATSQLDALARGLGEAYPAANKDQTLMVHKLRRVGISTDPGDDSNLAAVLGLLQAMSGILLLVACLNLANMMLAHGSARRKEIGVRLALGAGRSRVVRQLLVEGLLLSLAGGVAGLLLAYGATHLLAASLSGALSFTVDLNLTPDLRVLAATLGFAVLSTLMFGLWPAWRLARTDIVHELKQQVGESTGGRRRWLSLRDALMVGQVALSLALVTAAGLLVRSAIDAARVDPGYEYGNGLVASLDPGLAGYEEARGRQLYGRLLEEVRSLPGVRAASVASLISYGEVSDSETLRRPGTSGDEGRASGISNIVGADYFASLGLPVLRGREFTLAEEMSAEGARVALIDEPMAKRLFPGEDPLGQQVVFVESDDTPMGAPLEIVGVVPGLRHDLYDREPVPHVYTPFGQRYQSWMTLHVRHAGGGPEAEAALLQSVRAAIRGVDERLPVLWLRTLGSHHEASLFLWLARVGARMFSIFGALAVFLAAVGLYGVKAYLVGLRTKEIGVRMALGASRRDVLWLMVRDSLVLTGAGVVIGLGLAALVATAVAGLVFRASPFDPAVFASAVALIVTTAALAAYVPALRATRVEPYAALRDE